MGANESGMATKVAPMIKDAKLGGSTDVADVSWNTPVAVFGWPTYPLGVNLHTWAVTACGGTTIGDRASLDTARILAGIGHDLMRDADLRARVRADFEARRGGKPFVSLLPPEQRSPIGIPDWLRKSDDDEITAPLDVAL